MNDEANMSRDKALCGPHFSKSVLGHRVCAPIIYHFASQTDQMEFDFVSLMFEIYRTSNHLTLEKSNFPPQEPTTFKT